MSKVITLKVDEDLLKKVKSIASKKNPHRKIEKYAQGVNEALIEYVKENQKLL